MDVLGEGPGANHGHGDHVTMVLEKEAPGQVGITERHIF